MSTITSPIWQKDTSPEDIESDDTSTATTTTINDTEINDTDVPSQRQQSDTDTSGTTTRNMSLPRPSGPTIRLPPEGTPSPSSSSLQSCLNEEKLKDKLRTRHMHDQRTFLSYLPENFFLVGRGDINRFSEVCSQYGWHNSYLIQLGSLLPNGRQAEMGAHVGTSQSSLNERKLQEELRTMEVHHGTEFEVFERQDLHGWRLQQLFSGRPQRHETLRRILRCSK